MSMFYIRIVFVATKINHKNQVLADIAQLRVPHAQLTPETKKTKIIRVQEDMKEISFAIKDNIFETG